MSRFFTLLAVLFCGFLAAAAHGQVYISEFLADNQTTTAVDDNGDHSDWLEIWNSGTASVSLNGWYLTDTASNLRKWQFPVTTPSVTLASGARLLVWCSGKDRKLDVTKLHTNFKLSKNAGSYLALVKADGLTISHAYNSYPQQVQDIAYGFPTQTGYVTLLAPGATGRAKVPASAADMPANWNTLAFSDAAWTVGSAGFGYDTTSTYGSLLGTDLQSAMYLQNSTALIRIPFTASGASAYTALRLSMKYDDAYICYLNGTQIATSAGVPASPTWNSSATVDRAGSSTNIYDVLTLPTAQNSLVSGTNVLAIQLLNFTTGSTQDVDPQNTPNGSRCLALPFLEGNLANVTFVPAYLSTPTPGSTNSTAQTSVGPAISGVTSDVPRPTGVAGSPAITITAQVVSTIHPLAANSPVQLKYLVNYGSEVSVTMRDDGLAPDATANDGTFTGQIPATVTSTMGIDQMLRWRIVATDTASAVSTDPPYRDTTDNEQYYGTVSADGITTSQVPVMHWFVANAAASRTEAGTRCSLFFQAPNATKPRFYDNVAVSLHGQSSSGFPVNKKSQDFNFNEDNRFEWDGHSDRQRGANMITDYADKSKVRHVMAYDLFGRTHHLASHWAYQIRVQQNGAFWGTYDLVENGDASFLDRVGLDSQGALYKIYDTLSTPSTAEKKTGSPDTDFSDLTAMENALNTTNSLTSRRLYAYDSVDVPTLVNYLATMVLMVSNDFGHKNFYVYRDTFGTGEWSVLPWDLDLSFGHTWTSSQAYFNDDLDSQRGLVMGASASDRLMNLVTNTSSSTIAPEMAQMFLRRLRTLMDQELISATATDGPMEQRANQLLNLLDPPGASYLTDADLDLQKWGYWLDGSGTSISAPGADAATHDHGARKQTLRILNSNPNPPNPSATNNAEGLGDTTPAFFPGRRAKLYNGGLTLNSQPIPAAQAAVPTGLVIEYIDANPATGAGENSTQNNQREFFIIRNNSGTYVDMSGWKLKGAVTYTFRGGTVLPPFTSGSAVNATGDVHIGRLHMARNPAAFRARVTSPHGGQYRMVMGPYSGQLSARGEAIQLVIPGATDAQDIVVATGNVPATPTPSQNALRITELNYEPAAPTTSELAALPGVQAADFEFIEFTNTGATTLSLGGATFGQGVQFTFPAGYTLAAGARCVIVSLQAAFVLRYGSGLNIAGQYEGNLDNSGERLQLLDSVGEEVLDFSYDPTWYGAPTSGGGYSLVSRSNSPVWDAYGSPTSWAISSSPGGSPGTSENGDFSATFEGWRHDHFTPAEEATPVLADPASDPEGDGASNLYEYAFGTDPRAAGPHAMPTPVVVNVSGIDYGAVTYTRRRRALDLTFTIEVTSTPSDPQSWTAVNLPVGFATNLGNGLETVTYRSSQPTTTGPSFFRVKVTK